MNLYEQGFAMQVAGTERRPEEATGFDVIALAASLGVGVLVAKKTSLGLVGGIVAGLAMWPLLGILGLTIWGFREPEFLK